MKKFFGTVLVFLLLMTVLQAQPDSAKVEEEKNVSNPTVPNSPGNMDRPEPMEEPNPEPEPEVPPQQYDPPERREPPRRRRRAEIPPVPNNEVLQQHLKNAGSAKPKGSKSVKGKANLQKSSTTERMKLEVVDESITNVFRLISKTYKINIVSDPELNDVKVTIHLEDIPVMEGLEVLCRANNLEMSQVNGIVYVKMASEKAIAEMNLYRKQIDIKVENKPVKDFLKEFAAKTGISIVPDQDLEGKVTGHITNVLAINGLKALMKANGFKVAQKSNIYIIQKEDSENESVGGGRMRRRGNVGGGSFDIDIVDGNVQATLNNANLGEVIRSISNQMDRDLIMYGEVNGVVNANITDVPVDKALALLLKGTNYTFITRDGMILIGESKGSALSTVEIHPLKFIRADQKVLQLLPKSIATDEIKIVEEQNAVLISGTAENINHVKELLDQIDQPVPQVMIEVMIVEYERSNNSEFGVSPGKVTGIPSVSANMDVTGGVEKFPIGPFRGALAILPQNWDVYLRSQLSKTKGKVLAMPKITTLNGNKANLKVSGTRYYPATTVTKEGLPVADYRAIDDGITIDLTPWVTQHGDVNLEIKPSVKSTLPPELDGAPSPVKDRSVSTNVRLRDGQTLILGGLIDSKETNNREFVPILGHIPLLGYLFSWRAKSKETKELVIYVTPHILEADYVGVDLVDELRDLDKRSGFVKEKDFTGKPNGKKKEKPLEEPAAGGKDSSLTPSDTP